MARHFVLAPAVARMRFAVPAILLCLAACKSASNPWPSWNKCAPHCKEELGHDPGLEIAYGFLDEGDLESANQILANDWPVPRYDPAHLEPPLTWTEDPYGATAEYWRFVFYALRPTANLLWAFLNTEDLRYRDKLAEVVTSFAQSGQGGPYSWDKHGTAYRAMVLVNTYWKLKMAHALDPAFDQILLGLIEAQGVFLANPENFQGDFNHGFAEAAALRLVAENFPGLSSAQAWRTLAQDRLRTLIANAVDPDGVAYEQSPYYHFYILTQLWEISRWTATYALAATDNQEPAMHSMLPYATYVIQPNGWIPMIGTSQARNMRRYEPEVYSQIAQSDPAFAYVLSAGRQGREPTERFVLFPSSGQAIFRSGFGPPEQFEAQTHVHFDVGPWRTKHSDLDALSVNVYSAGRTLLPDSGFFTENPEAPEFAYFRGTRAHNTVVVDESDQQRGGCTVGLAAVGGSWSYLSASHVLYPGVVHARSVLLLARDLVLVVDRLLGTGPHVYDQTWHLPPDADFQLNGTTITAVTPAGSPFITPASLPLITLRQARPDGMTILSAKGAMAPVDGWYSEKELVKEPAYSIRCRKQGPEARFVTLLSSGPHAGHPAGFAADGDDQHMVVSVCSGDVKLQVTLDGLGGPGEAVQVGPLAACPPAN